VARWSPEPFDRLERHEGRCTATRGAAKPVCAVQRWQGQSRGHRCRLLLRAPTRGPPITHRGVAGLDADVVDYPIDEWKRVFDVNIYGLFYCNRYVGP
jgi:NAD(P)-dependent dehydrogenase (short-subunit alcohol dehydrogenase family)